MYGKIPQEKKSAFSNGNFANYFTGASHPCVARLDHVTVYAAWLKQQQVRTLASVGQRAPLKVRGCTYAMLMKNASAAFLRKIN